MLVALHKSKGLVARLIQWQTRSQYSHASIVMADGDIIEAREGIGVQRIPSRGIEPDVDYFTIEATANSLFEMGAFLRAQIGKPYDYTMVLRFISRRQEGRKSSGKWFCSELVFAAFQKAGINLLERCEPWEVSPGLLAKSPLLKRVSQAGNQSVSAGQALNRLFAVAASVLLLGCTATVPRTTPLPLPPQRITHARSAEFIPQQPPAEIPEGITLTVERSTNSRPHTLLVWWRGVGRPEVSTNAGATWTEGHFTNVGTEHDNYYQTSSLAYPMLWVRVRATGQLATGN